MRPHTLIRDARKAAGLTQAQLAARAGMAQPTIARLERPGSNPTVETLDRVLRATGHRLELGAPERVPGIDESQLRERAALTPEQRMATFRVSHRNLDRFVQRARRVERAAT